ncbi:MAG: 4-alpha-glucanotransferase, partial [Spirochaetes bacterium]|nr:4-alpha-glucanotransferase [Spirochaetota bacterium]
MKLKRSAGILCHITSLPGRYGTGTLGQEAYDFIDLVAGGGFSYIQILPVGPVSPSMGWSPYSSVSAFAGNELFISPDIMASEKWSRTATEPVTLKESHKADFFSARDHLRRCIINSFHDFVLYADGSDSLAFSRFCDDHNESWLD